MKRFIFILIVLVCLTMACSFSIGGDTTGESDAVIEEVTQPGNGDQGGAVEDAMQGDAAAGEDEIYVDLETGRIVLIPLDGSAFDNQGGLAGECINTTPVPDRFNRANGAISFNGLDSYVSFEDNDIFDLTGDFTIGFFIKGNSTTEHEWLIMTKHQTGVCQPDDTSWMIRYEEAYGLRFMNYDTTVDCGKVILAAPDVDLLDDQWHHIAMVYDKAALEMKLYVDGIFVINAFDTKLNISNNSIPLLIGNQYQGVPQHALDAALDEIVFYDVALDAQQVDALANQGE